jgi:hypothetical protein
MQDRRYTIVPLALTDIEDDRACVCGPTLDGGEWVRPQPVPRRWVVGDEPAFRYGWTATFVAAASSVTAGRPEERALADDARPTLERALDQDEWRALLERTAEDDVDAALRAGRSAVLTRTTVTDARYRRGLGGRHHLRFRFDAGGTPFDCIVADRAVRRRFDGVDPADAQPLVDDVLALLADAPAYLTICLSQPGTGFPGPYGGAHALVTGVHLPSGPADAAAAEDRQPAVTA